MRLAILISGISALVTTSQAAPHLLPRSELPREHTHDLMQTRDLTPLNDDKQDLPLSIRPRDSDCLDYPAEIQDYCFFLDPYALDVSEVFSGYKISNSRTG